VVLHLLDVAVQEGKVGVLPVCHRPGANVIKLFTDVIFGFS
jgi:hypothetical protein